ncbi:OmpA family protein [Roseivivax isoporae]|nr:OmpA family protein [Roseivivax isoporae]
MTFPTRFFRCAAVVSVLAVPLPALAQDDLSVEQLKSLFERQKDAFREARRSDLGETRGLKLVTVDDVRAEAPEAAAPAADMASAPSAPAVSDVSPNVTTETATLAAPDVQAGDGSGVSVSAAASGSAAVPADPNRPLLAAAEPDAPMVFGRLDPDLQVNLHIEFGFDSAALGDDQKPKLAKMCQVLNEAAIDEIMIVGHTDAAGSDAYNERLSVLRAKEVARHLVDDCGVAPGRLRTVGMGERFLYNPADPRADENRRVEFQALS